MSLKNNFSSQLKSTVMEIIGRVTQDATVKTVKNDRQLVSFSIAINDYYKTKEGDKKKLTTYVDCAYWRSTKVADSLKKGTLVSLYGRIGANAYTNMQGDVVANLTFHVNNIQFVGSAKSNTPATQQAETTVSEPETADDLPF
jgi:single-strand DNA-binding protein